MSSWFRNSKTNPGAQLRLICLPHAGGGATAYARWAAELPKTIELWPAQLPGRESRFNEPALKRIEPLVDQLAQAVRPLLDRPYAVFGHSMGALVGFELVRALRRLGLPAPVCLFASAHAAPGLPLRHEITYTLPTPQFIAYVRSLDGTPQEILENEELLELMVPLLRSDFELLETYVPPPGPPLECPVRVFGGDRDPSVSLEDLEAWREHSQRFLGVRTLPGGHFYLQEQRAPLLRWIVEDLAPYLG